MESTNEKPRAFKAKGKWHSLSKQLKKEFPKLTSRDLNIESDDPEDMLLRVGKRLNKLRPEVIQLIRAIGKPIRELVRTNKQGITLRSNLMHDYYAVNSVDGVKDSKPIIKITSFNQFNHWWQNRASIYFRAFIYPNSYVKQV